MKTRLQSIKTWAVNSLTAFDVFLNVFIFMGLQDETMSAHAGRLMLAGSGWGKFCSYMLEYPPLGWIFGHKHVQGAIIHDEERAAAIVAVEEAARKTETGSDQKII